VQSSGKQRTGANVLQLFFSEQDSQSVYLMRQENVGRLDVIQLHSHGSTKPRSGMRGDNDQLGVITWKKVMACKKKQPQVHSETITPPI